MVPSKEQNSKPLGPIAKSEAAFRTIGEVAVKLNLPQHVLRFWEGKFPQIKPVKRGGLRRYYRPEDIAVLRRIQNLLYHDGYTIKGVQKVLKERTNVAKGLPIQHLENNTTEISKSISELKLVLIELQNIRKLMY
jgi:DNA-binding transcriptional MerR regulator